MITWKSPQFPDYTAREKNGLLIGFLASVNLRNKNFGVFFCEGCGNKSIEKLKHKKQCKSAVTELITLENALKYVTHDTLNNFLNVHRSDQYRYIEDIITKEYTYDTPITTMFCCNCYTMELFRHREASDFYFCDRRCKSEFCMGCVTSRNTVMNYDKVMRWDQWLYQSTCYKHDTLFYGLYKAIFIECYYKN